MTAPTSYVYREDWSAVDAAHREAALREHEIVRARRAEIFGRYARYLALIMAATGVTVLLASWGLSLLLETPEPKVVETQVVVEKVVPVEVVKEVVVEKPVAYQPIIHIEGQLVDSPQATMNEIAEEVKRQDRELVIANAASPIVYNYVVFKEISLSEGTVAGYETLSMAMEFSDSNKAVPSYQECFLQRAGADATARKITLAVKEDGARRDLEITPEMAEEGGTSVAALETARALCRFL